MIRKWNVLVFLIIGFMGFNSVSQESTQSSKSSSSDSAKKKNTMLNFEDELVTGDASQPEVMSIMQRQDFNFKRLIRLRKNFLHEMRKTAEDIERIGSVD